MVPPTVAVVDDAGTRRTARALERDGYETAEYAETIPPLSKLDGRTDAVVTEVDVLGAEGIPFAGADSTALPVVVYTDRGSEAVASRAITAGVDEYVRKSRGPEELLAVLDRVFEENGGADDGTGALPGEKRSDRRGATAATVVGEEAGRTHRTRELERYRHVVETVGDMIYTLDETGTVTFANRAFEDYIGANPEELIGTDAADVLPKEAYDRGLGVVHALLEADGRSRGRYEFQLEGPDGDVRHFENEIVVYCDGDGHLSGTAGVIRDVTQRKEQERKLRRQKERLEEFSDIVGHDLRNPLNVIDGRIELLRRTGDLGHLDELEECTARMEALLSDLLALARDGRDVEVTEEVPLERVAANAWGHVETDGWTLELEDGLGTVEADPTRVEQLFENLFRNSLEHGVADGSDDALTVAVERTDDEFAVTDDGDGVDPTDRDRIFDRGFTTRVDGTGLGLSIVSSIAEAHGWTVELDETYDDGARFAIRIR